MGDGPDVFETGELMGLLPVAISRKAFEACLDEHFPWPKVVGVAMEDFYGLRDQYPNAHGGVTPDRWRVFQFDMPYFLVAETMVVGVNTSCPSMLLLLEHG